MIHAVTMYFYLDLKLGSHEKPRLVRRSTFGNEGKSSPRNASQTRGHSLGCLPQGPAT